MFPTIGHPLGPGGQGLGGCLELRIQTKAQIATPARKAKVNIEL